MSDELKNGLLEKIEEYESIVKNLHNEKKIIEEEISKKQETLRNSQESAHLASNKLHAFKAALWAISYQDQQPTNEVKS